MSMSLPLTATPYDQAYETGWNEAVDAFAALLRSARYDMNYPADAHAFVLHDLMLAKIIAEQLKEKPAVTS